MENILLKYLLPFGYTVGYQLLCFYQSVLGDYMGDMKAYLLISLESIVNNF